MGVGDGQEPEARVRTGGDDPSQWCARGLSSVESLPLDRLLPADSPREGGDSAERVRMLARSHTPLPPIIVHRSSMRVIDGMHRLRVARRRGRQSIEARFFEGSPQDAFVLAVEANVTGGLPLAQAERVTAAARIVRTHPHWSDRAIASVTGLSAKTVGAQRRRLGGSAVPEEVRVGRDGRTRPLSSARGRRIASRLLAETPNASLREIAKKAGISPGTVRDVRRRLERGENPVPPRQRSAQPRQTSRPGVTTHAQATARGAAMADLRTQPAPALSEMETLLLCMMEIHTTDAEQWDRMADSVPAHYARAVSVMAAACADAWHNLAVALRGSPPGGRGGQGGAAHRGPVTTAPTV